MQTPDTKPPRAPTGAPLLIAVCLALLLFVSIGVVVSHADSPAAATLKILVPQSTSSLPFLLLAEQQPLKGVEIRVETFLNHAQALALLLRGEADLLFTGTSQGWENRLDGSPLVMLDTGVWGVSSLVGRDASIRSFSELKGKRLALPFPGAPLDFQTRAILAHAGLDPDKDLTISYGAFPQSVPLLLAGKLDAAALPEPLATNVVKTKGLARLVRYADAWQAVTGDARSPQVSLFAAEQWVRANRAPASSLLAAWQAASRTIAGSPAGSLSRFAPALGVDPSLMDEAVTNTLFDVPGPAVNKAKVTEYYRQVARFLPGPSRALDDGFFFAP